LQTSVGNLPGVAKAVLLARNGKLSVDAAREVIAQGVADVFTQANVCFDFPMNNSFIVFY